MPTKSGVIIERRDQVLIGVLDLVSFALMIFSIRWPSTNGPFLIDRPITKNWSVGVMEYWRDERIAPSRASLQHSSTPPLHYSVSVLCSLVFHRPAISPDEDEAVRIFLLLTGPIAFGQRSEARRVGIGCRWRWAVYGLA